MPTYQQVRDAITGVIIPVANQALPVLKIGALLTATKVDDNLLEGAELGVFVVNEVFTDPEINAKIEEFIQRKHGARFTP